MMVKTKTRSANNSSGFNFEEFQSGRILEHTKPIVSFQFSGRMALNKMAYELLGEPDAVVFLFDRAKNILGIRAATQNSVSSYAVTPVTSKRLSVTINPRGALKHFGIPLQKSRYAVELATDVPGGAVLTIDLNDPYTITLASERGEVPNTNNNEDDETQFGK